MTIAATLPGPDALIAEANHRIGNSLALIAALVRRHAATISAWRRPVSIEEILAALGEAEIRIEAVGRLHRLLAEAESGTAVNLGDYLRDIADAAVSSLSCPGRVALSHKSAAGCIAPAGQALPIALIAGELITNAIKYAHPTGVAGKISVGCHRAVEDMIVVEVADDGIGLPEGYDPMSQGGLGLRLARSLAKRLQAKLMFQSNSIGLRVRLLVPAVQVNQDDAGDASMGSQALSGILPQ